MMMKITRLGGALAIAGALSVYSAVVCTASVTGAMGSARETNPNTLNVERINVREPDGILRMVISNKGSFPGIITHGHELPHASREDVAGMVFYNDEATENGGLIFAGRKLNGQVRAGGHLSFDQYDQDQVINLEQTEDGSTRSAGLGISDRPSKPLDFAAMANIEAMPNGPEKQAAYAKHERSDDFGQPRLFLGKTGDSSVLSLRDAQGRKRLVLRVDAAGEAAIQFLDDSGKVVKTVTQAG